MPLEHIVPPPLQLLTERPATIAFDSIVEALQRLNDEPGALDTNAQRRMLKAVAAYLEIDLT